MKYLVAALALCFALSPLEAAPKSYSANTHVVKAKVAKAKKNKVKGRKPVRRQSRSRSRVN
jgi:hypothetical protein